MTSSAARKLPARTVVRPLAGTERRVFTSGMQPHEEAKALAEVAERLRARFPMVQPDTIDKVVQDYHHEFEGTPIRDFIPVLVEREVREQLRSGQAALETRSPRSTARSRPLENA